MTVTFDQPLRPGVSAQPNWVGTADTGGGPLEFAAQGVPAVAGRTVTFGTGNTGVGAGADRVSYLAAPADVISLHAGIPAPGFVDFPLTVLP